MAVVRPVKVTNPSRWRTKYSKKGICNFDLNYDFYFKWLLNKVASCFIIRGGDDTKVNKNYLKLNLILNGGICVTDFKDEIYACVGNIGGKPDEYYVPTEYIISNPILGSKTVRWRDFDGAKKNGVLITNTAIDLFIQDILDCGLYTLIHQTACLLADNIVSINCCQINTRVVNFFTAESKTQAAAGEAVLQEMYAGTPYKILRSDIVNKLQVAPTANSGVSQNITELVELHNYIIANFFQSIGIISNNVMKRERLINAEIEEQNASVNLSLTEMLESWKRGFDEVNDLYGTDFEVLLNPVIVQTLLDALGHNSGTVEATDGSIGYNNVVEKEAGNPATDEVTDGSNGAEQEPETEDATVVGASETDTGDAETTMEQAEEVIEELAEYLTGSSDETEGEGGEVGDDLQTNDATD